MKWAEISIQTSHEATEAVAEIFHELGASGVLIEDPELVNTYIHSGAWDYTDIPLAEETEVVTVKAWLPTDEDLPSKLEQLRLHIDEMSQFLDKGSGVINCSEIQDEDWANNWKQFFHPERIGEKIVVKPSWEEYTPLDNDIVIELDPGMAFGTGTHATTSMCIQLLEEYVKPEMKVFDVGTGSGILAIAASKLGAKDIEAADYDNVAVDVARENIEKNHECENIKIFQSDLLKNMNGKDVAPTAITVLKFRPNPNKITAYCKTFLEVNVIPLFKISFSRTNFDNSIPSKMAKTGPPMISNSLPKK